MSTGMVWSVPPPKWIHWWMLYRNRQYVIEKIKKPLKKAIAILAMRYPEPTKDHTLLPNTHRLIDIRDKFFEHQVENETLFRAIWKMFIVEYEHDPYYRYRIDWVIEELSKGGWVAKPTKPPDKCWKE